MTGLDHLLNIPPPVREVLWQRCLGSHALAYVEVTDAGMVASAGGALAAFGLGGLSAGNSVQDALGFLVGMLPHRGPNLTLHAVQTPGTGYADVHLSRIADVVWVVLIDVSASTSERAEMLQTINERGLAQERTQHALESIAALELAVFEQIAGPRFRLVGVAPAWFTRILPALAPGDELDLAALSSFLENFLWDAEAHWAQHPAEQLESMRWRETFGDAGDLELIATAVAAKSSRARMLLVRHLPGDEPEERLLQRARDSSMAHETMVEQLEQKEVLLHCIIHDLGAPLAAMAATLSTLQSAPPEQQPLLLEIGQRQAERQHRLIQQILEVFQADRQPPAQAPPEASDLAAALEAAADIVAPSFRRSAVELRRHFDAAVLVRGDRTRLERMIVNLLENALRYAPRGSAVELSAQRVGLDPPITGSVRKEITGSGSVRIEVADRGPGVPEAARATLFEKLQQGPHKTGRLGLGLYFCRITAQAFGGRVGFVERPGGGALFWIELPLPSQ
ncbi:MAG: HAMP domain-containing sensor histidine kinase [Myxococcota bacterium]